MKKIICIISVIVLLFTYSILDVEAVQKDKTPPSVISTSPKTGQINVGINTSISIIFNEHIKNGYNVDKIKLIYSKNKSQVVSLIILDNELLIIPFTKLYYAMGYSLTIPAGSFEDNGGNTTSKEILIRFKTLSDKTNPRISVIPTLNAKSKETSKPKPKETPKPKPDQTKKPIRLIIPTPEPAPIFQHQDGVAVITSQGEYRSIIKYAMENFESSINFIIKGYSDEIYGLNVINDIQDNNPLIDYGYSKSSIKMNWTGDESERNVEISFKYDRSKDEMLKMRFEASQKAIEIVKKIIKPDMTDYEKELVIHDYIINNARYDADNYFRNTIPTESYTDYGVLVLHKGVCESYSKAMFRLLNLVGIKCLYITGTGNGSDHAWNLVKIGKSFYHLDATWDDPIVSNGSDRLRHDYFNLNDKEMEKSHKWDKSKYPVCNDSTYKYNSV